MGHTRTLTGTIHRPDGEPWENFQLDFTLVPSAVTTHATLPSATVSATTETDGTFAIDLEVDVTYQVSEYSALIRSGTSTRYPSGTQYTIVVPDGDTSISLHEIRAADATPVTPTLAGRVLPEGGATGQALVKASDTDYDAAWGDVDGGSDVAWGSIGGEIGDQADLATALGGKADDADVTAVGDALAAHTGDTANPHGVTAAQVGAYTTGEVDTALAGKANTGDIPALPATIVESVVAGENVTVDSTDPAHPVVSAAGGGGVELAGDGTAETAARSDHQHAVEGHSTTVSIGAGQDLGPTSQPNKTAIGALAQATYIRTVAVGAVARAISSYATTVGSNSMAFGVRSTALGYNAVSDTANTAVIKANDLDVQRSNGTGVTRYSLYAADGTKLWLSAESDGAGGWQLVLTPA